MTVPEDRVEALRQRFDEPLPESWIAKDAGDELVGTFVRLDKGTTTYGDCWIVVLESARNPGTFASVWLINQALVNEFSRARPVPGELVAVRYGGKKPVKNPTPGRSSEYHDWKVVVDRESADAPPPDWNALTGDPGPVLQSGGDFHHDAAPPYSDDDVPF